MNIMYFDPSGANALGLNPIQQLQNCVDIFSLTDLRGWIDVLERLPIEEIPRNIYCQTMIKLIQENTVRWNKWMEEDYSRMRPLYRLAWKAQYSENKDFKPTDILNTALAHASSITRKHLVHFLSDFASVDEGIAHDIGKYVDLAKTLQDEESPLYTLIQNNKMREAWTFLEITGNTLSENAWVKLWEDTKEGGIFSYGLIPYFHERGMPLHAHEDIILPLALERQEVNGRTIQYLMDQQCNWTAHDCRAMFAFYAWSRFSQTANVYDGTLIETIQTHLQTHHEKAWKYVQYAMDVGLPRIYRTTAIESLDIPEMTP